MNWNSYVMTVIMIAATALAYCLLLYLVYLIVKLYWPRKRKSCDCCGVKHNIDNHVAKSRVRAGRHLPIE